MRKAVFAVLVMIGLAALAVQTGMARPLIKWQVERSLVAGGMGEGRADCMAGRVTDRLSVWQIYKLQRAMAPREGEPAEARGIIDTITRLRRSEDGEIVSVVTTSAALCAIGLG